VQFCSLGSGSAGNALLVRTTNTCVMVDCGFGRREFENRLRSRGMLPADVDAIIVTHEHSDHVGGVLAIARHYRIPVHASSGTIKAAGLEALAPTVLVSEGVQRIGDLDVLPITVPHDAREPCQFVLEHSTRRLGVLTDIGSLSRLVRWHYRRCDALVLECNHDTRMLADGPYPYPLKKRIGGDLGHLSNAQAADLLASIERGALQHLVAAHLSEQNNTPARARESLQPLLTGQEELRVANQESGFDWLTIV
jgi:phosphoribosyl 1,2-cyclic phosphodiesterase